jgi:hypothetical protein
VSVGDVADTAEFAVASIRRWWDTMGRDRFPNATKLMITADGGGSNGSRVRAWKWHLARLGADTGVEVTVCPYPPGTSKWNKIEHRLSASSPSTGRAAPSPDIGTIVELIASTTTQGGLEVQATYDPNWYATGQKITDKQINQLPLHRHDRHGDWNYTITPTEP